MLSHLRDAEVGDACEAINADEDVRGADVAVDDVEQAAVVAQPMGGVEPIERVRDDVCDEARRSPPAVAAQELLERAALDVVHDDVMDALLTAHVAYAHYVVVVDAGGDPRLFEEHVRELGVFGQWHLGDAQLRGPRGADRPHDVHHTHAAARELAEQLVVSEADRLSHSLPTVEELTYQTSGCSSPAATA